MEREIRISINADITIKTTKEEEKILNMIDNASWTDTFSLSDEDDAYDEAMDKLGELIRNRLEKTYGKDFHILDINWD